MVGCERHFEKKMKIEGTPQGHIHRPTDSVMTLHWNASLDAIDETMTSSRRFTSAFEIRPVTFKTKSITPSILFYSS